MPVLSHLQTVTQPLPSSTASSLSLCFAPHISLAAVPCIPLLPRRRMSLPKQIQIIPFLALSCDQLQQMPSSQHTHTLRPVPVVSFTSVYVVHCYICWLSFHLWKHLWKSWIRVSCTVWELPVGTQAELKRAGLRHYKSLQPLTQLSGLTFALRCLQKYAPSQG